MVAALPLLAAEVQPYVMGDGIKIKFDEQRSLTLGGDIRFRLENYDRESRNLNTDKLPNGPWIHYTRTRERVWADLQLGDGMFFKARLVNRWQYYWSNQGGNNTDEGDNSAGTTNVWKFPDEFIFDQFQFGLNNINGSNFSVLAGRQDLILGNGMIMAEGTTWDGGRTIYFDGVSANWVQDQDPKKNTDTAKAFAFYNAYKDEAPVINDQNRKLRRGDTGVLGGQWIHQWDANKVVNTDAYLLYVDADSSDMENTWPCPPFPKSYSVTIPGLRIFGQPHKLVDYSVEAAREFGDYGTGNEQDVTGTMIDARLGLALPFGQEEGYKPKFNLEYTYFSGDDKTTSDTFEGWIPVLDEYPIWREELYMPYGTAWPDFSFTNLHQYRVAYEMFVLPKKVKVTAAYAYLRAEQGENGSGCGSNRGHLLTAFVDYTPKPWLSFALETSTLFPGDYYQNGNVAHFVRLQTTIKF